MEKIYKVEYSSQSLTGSSKYIYIKDNCNYNKDDYVIVYKEDTGFFIGRIDDVDNDGSYNVSYHIVRNISDTIAIVKEDIEKITRKKELAKKMEEQFAIIDKEKKFEYYATLDADFANIYNEYKTL
jgi:phosphoribosylpyrophosphate synthetase